MIWNSIRPVIVLIGRSVIRLVAIFLTLSWTVSSALTQRGKYKLAKIQFPPLIVIIGLRATMATPGYGVLSNGNREVEGVVGRGEGVGSSVL